MEMLMGVPALIKVLCLFASIVLMYRLKLPLWAALFVATIAAGFWFGEPVRGILVTTGRSSVSAETVFFTAIVVMIMGFSNMLVSAGLLPRIVDVFGKFLGKSMYSAAALPALIGLLPMPGGAVFSAPMVESACDTAGCKEPDRKCAVNHWFRHIWEFWWPLYPGVILASQLFSIPSWKMFLLHIPFTVVSLTSGYFFILKPSFKNEIENGTDEPAAAEPLGNVLKVSSPILIAILSIFVLGPFMKYFGVSELGEKYWPVDIGMALGCLWIIIGQKMKAAQVLKSFFKGGMASMLLVVVGTMAFKDMLMAVNAFEAARADLVSWRVPLVVVVAALPMIAGLVMGMTIGYVGASFPLVLSLLPKEVLHSDARYAWFALAYGFGFTGMLLSPVHLCLVLTRDFFKADFLKTYKNMAIPAAIIISTGIALFFVYQHIFPVK